MEHPEKYSVESPCGGLVRARQKQAIAMHPDDVDMAGECAAVRDRDMVSEMWSRLLYRKGTRAHE